MSRKHDLLAGFARADITPPGPITNYKGNSLGLPPHGAPRLECLAAMLSAGGSTVGLVALDTTNVSRSLVGRIRAEAGRRRHEIDLAGLVISATHTHCAPHLAPMFLASDSDPDLAYEDLLAEQVLEALSLAGRDAGSVELYAGIAPAPGFEFSRRYLRPDGRVVTTMASDDLTGLPPCAEIDREVPFWLFRSSSGEPVGLVLSYACHNNAARAPFMAPDIAGYCRIALGEQLGRQTTVLMLEGACGDVGWIDPGSRPQGGVEHAERIGRALADSVAAAVRTAKPVAVHEMVYRSSTLTIPDRTPDESEYCEDACRGSSPGEIEAQRKRYHPERVAVGKRGSTSAEVEIAALILGGTALITNPAELFCSLGKEIRRHSRFPVTLLAELSNGYAGYVPREEDFDSGGYETHRTVYSSRLAKWAGREIVDRSVELLNS